MTVNDGIRTRNLSRFGDEIREAMVESGFTVERLAAILDVSPSTVAKWRDGSRMPRLDIAFRLAALLDVPLDSLWSTELDAPNP